MVVGALILCLDLALALGLACVWSRHALRLKKERDAAEQALLRRTQAVVLGLADPRGPEPEVLLWTPEGIRKKALALGRPLPARRIDW